jgi:pimeloyl-ACP methyl ester carboxylesterase
LSAENRDLFLTMFDGWATQLQSERVDVESAALAAFREHMFGGDFVFSVDRDFVRQCAVPMLVLAGNDSFHPTAVAEEIASLANHAELVLEWTSPTHHDETRQRVREFLLSHTP